MPAGYGSKEHPWHPAFVQYAEEMARHPAYSGMPDTYNDAKRVQWEAPSNRQSGKFQHTYRKRLDWWRRKAIASGIDPDSARWKSRTAKLIHPTMAKPCRRCGVERDLRYVYPKKLLIDRFRKLYYLNDDFEFSQLEPIYELLPRLHSFAGERILSELPRILATSHLEPPTSVMDLAGWLKWIEEEYVPAEPSTLSPGAMSNCPDRFDGFHHLNICCRSRHDPGRAAENLRGYATDRRASEYWVDGDWIAADRLMGLIRRDFVGEECRHGHPGPCTADHIGPLSLGFAHRPEFQLLCKTCNSAKNNRMMLSDVIHLRQVEAAGEQVASWHSQVLWDLRKASVCDEETALRLSKLLRDNHHTVMALLGRFSTEAHLVFLASFLDLQYAEYDVRFNNLRVEHYHTVHDGIRRVPRATSYATEQKVRRIRVAFTALREYLAKPSGNAHIFLTEAAENHILAALAHLEQAASDIRAYDTELASALAIDSQIYAESRISALLPSIEHLSRTEPCYRAARLELEKSLREIAASISSLWMDDRYVRGEFSQLLPP